MMARRVLRLSLLFSLSWAVGPGRRAARAESLFGFRAAHDLSAGLSETVSWYLRHVSDFRAGSAA